MVFSASFHTSSATTANPPSRLSRAGSLDGRVQGQKVGLISDIRDDREHPADIFGLFSQLVHVLLQLVRLRLHLPHCPRGHRLTTLAPVSALLRAESEVVGGHGRVSGHFQDGCCHLFHGCGGLRNAFRPGIALPGLICLFVRKVGRMRIRPRRRCCRVCRQRQACLGFWPVRLRTLPPQPRARIVPPLLPSVRPPRSWP